jgi:hypothetical protein
LKKVFRSYYETLSGFSGGLGPRGAFGKGFSVISLS